MDPAAPHRLELHGTKMGPPCGSLRTLQLCEQSPCVLVSATPLGSVPLCSGLVQHAHMFTLNIKDSSGDSAGDLCNTWVQEYQQNPHGQGSHK